MVTGTVRFRSLVFFAGHMLKKIKHPDPQNYWFAALLVFSIVLHAVVLSQLQWKIKIPDRSEVVFEVQLVEPKKKIIPPKRIRPEPVVIKNPEPRKKQTPAKLSVSKKQTASLPEGGKPEPAAKTQPKPPKKQPPVIPVPKPSLSLTSDVSQSSDLKKSEFSKGISPTSPPSTRPFISGIKVPDSKAEDLIPTTVNKPPALKINPEDLKTAPSADNPDSSQIAASNKQTDVKTEIRRQKDAVRFRVVEQKVNGDSPAKGGEGVGNNMIEGELKQRKVIYKPDPPVMNLERDVTITLKFTVLPNGEVDQIFPYRKADSKLERLAMRLLRQYRFEPLFENDKVQHGIIHFSVRRNRLGD